LYFEAETAENSALISSQSTLGTFVWTEIMQPMQMQKTKVKKSAKEHL
jgi:hypothetical protein